MFKKFIKKAALMLGAVLLATSIPVSTQAKPKELSKSVKAGDTVYFGKYEQDGNTKNGKEKIEWQVLEKKGNKALLISKKILDVQPYNKEYKEHSDIAWGKCTLRKWLNKDFMKAAFNVKESKKIQNSKIKNEYVKAWGANSGKDTTDKVFILSEDELDKYCKTKEKRVVEITNYGIKRLAKSFNQTEKECKTEFFSKNNNWGYLLRTPFHDPDVFDNVISLDSDGECYHAPSYCDDGVRPGLWVKLQ